MGSGEPGRAAIWWVFAPDPIPAPLLAALATRPEPACRELAERVEGSTTGDAAFQESSTVKEIRRTLCRSEVRIGGLFRPRVRNYQERFAVQISCRMSSNPVTST
jgi:hypothetical protein